jgi:hypothetical protein
MSLYQLKTFEDIYSMVLDEAQVSSSDTTMLNSVKRAVNAVYQDLAGDRRWTWLEGNTTVQLPAYVSSGTVAVTQGSGTVTLSIAPTSSKTGFYFAVDGYSEIYKIESHTAASTTVKLSETYTGSTASTASYKIWTDKLPLPVDCKETVEVWHNHHSKPLENVGRQEFRRISQLSPRSEGKPSFYFTGDHVDPSVTASISGLPAVSTRASSGVVKTIVFAGSLPTAVVTAVTDGNPVYWRISAAGHPSYNGDILVASVSTTTNSNDTITYTGRAAYTESATADTTMSISAIGTEGAYKRHRELFVYPALSSSNVTLNVDYSKEVYPLENDNDEPLLPQDDRMVLVYGALHRIWAQLRNPEEAARNLQLYEHKLRKMTGRLEDSFDTPKLRPSSRYLGAKRSARTKGLGAYGNANISGGIGGAKVITGAANTVAVFNAQGELEGSSVVSTTELAALDGVSGTLVSTTATQTLTNKTIVAASNTITTAASGNLAATELNAALAELQTDIDSRASAADLNAHTADTTDAHDASAISVTPAGNLAADDVQEALTELQTDIDTRATSTALTNHIDDAADAHAASAITNTPSGNLAATNVQTALNELQTDIDSRATSADLTAHTGDTTDAHDASAISVAATGNISSTNVQAALEEIQTELDGVGGAVVQIVQTQTSAVSTGTTTIPFDDTIPQNTEGNEFLTRAITPTSATNELHFDINILASVNTDSRHITVALFQDTTANALAVTSCFTANGTKILTISLTHKMTAGTTSATTFKVRIGCETSGTITLNGESGSRVFGGVAVSSIRITEVVP